MTAVADALRALADAVDAQPLGATMATEAPSPWLDPADCEVSERSVRTAIAAGELPAYRVGRRLLVAREDFDRWIMRHRVAVVPKSAEATDTHEAYIARLAAGVR